MREAGEEQNNQGQPGSAEQAQQEDVAGAALYVGLLEQGLKVGDAGGAAQQVVERRDLAHYFVAQQRQFLAGLAFRRLLHGREAFAQQASFGAALVQQGSDDKHCQRHHDENRNVQSG